MRVAKHVQIARTKGAQAGLDAFLAAPVSKLHDSYAEIMSKRKPETRLKAYCNLFGVTEKPQAQTQRTTRTARTNGGTTEGSNAPTVSDEDAALLAEFAAFKAFKQQVQGVSTPVDTADDDVDEIEDTDDEQDVEIEYITHDEAWQALGSDAAFRAAKQERRDGPATNGQLFRLNELGLLAIVVDDDEDDDA